MTETPERIALDWKPGVAVTSGPLFEAGTRWVREDVALAMVAAALDRAVRACENTLANFEESNPTRHDALPYLADGCEACADAIKYLTPDDARDALDRLIAEAVEDEREACASLVATSGCLDDDRLAEAIRARKG